MSADNWAVCPRCARRRLADLAEQKAQIDAAYGTVDVAEFDQMRAAYKEAAEARLAPTFREDYEFYGAEEGSVTATYRGGCSECGLALKFEDVHEMSGLDQ